MSIPGSAEPLLLAQQDATATGYQIQRSLRFNSSDSAYLSRTPASAGNRNTWTWAGWVKRSDLGNALNYTLFSSTTDSYDLSYNQIQFETGNKIRLKFADGGIITLDLTTNAVFRDASAWYHILIAVDTTQSAQQSRVSIYINGALQALTGTYPGQNANTIFNKASASHHLAGSPPISEYFSGYLADVHFIDGQALTPSSFTEVSTTTGQLVPKAYTGSFGTNGFWLKFSDNSAATATTLGKDYSGNSNNWSPTNLSVTAGAGNDSLVDTPTSYGTDTGAGGEVRGNYCTWSPVASNSSAVISNGNLDNDNATTYATVKGTFALASGKWYWEYTLLSAPVGFALEPIGLADINMSATAGYVGLTNNNSAGVSLNYLSNLDIYVNSSVVFTTTGCSINDVIGVAYDADSKKLWFSRNGTWLGPSSPNPATGTSPISTALTGTQVPACSLYDTKIAANFGQRPFAYTAPSGFKALCTQNLPAPVVAKPNTVMDVKLYTGNGSTQTISGLGFSPDLVWIKKRSGSEWHCINDTVRGAELYLSSNTTNAESGANNVLTAFTSTGYTVGSQGIVNDNGFTFASWCWDAGSSTVTNTDGTISSQVRANASAGFSILTYTGATNSSTIGHGLGVAPSLIINKSRGGAGQWVIYHAALGYNYYGGFNTAAFVNNIAAWKTSPTSSVYTIGSAAEAPILNTTGETYVSYCFAPVAGYSAFGSYTGNGSSDGPFVYTGFRPAFVMLKRTDAIGNWVIHDNKRQGYNVNNDWLYPNLANSEASAVQIDMVSNGFKQRLSTTYNISSGTYIYAAFAESPFQYARAR